MRSLAAITLMVAVFAIPACAQHGGAHGGFSGHASFTGHSAPVVHGSGSARTAQTRPLAPRNSGGIRSSSPVSSFRPHPPGTPIGRSRYPGGDHNRGDGHRRAYVSPNAYGLGYPYYGYTPWLGGYDPNFSGTSNDSDSSDTQAASANTDSGNQGGQDQAPDYGQYPGGYGPPDVYPPAPRNPYQPSASEPHPSATLETEAAVTLVFKDGRPPEQVHNYVLTRTTLYVQDKNRRNIPVAELDIAATAKTNLDAGVEFQVPTLPN